MECSKEWPAATNLAGVLNWQTEEGHLELDTKDSIIKAASYPEQHFSLLNAVVYWKKLSQGLRISIERALATEPELTISTQECLMR